MKLHGMKMLFAIEYQHLIKVSYLHIIRTYFWGACPTPDHGIVTHWVDGGGGVPRDAQCKAVVVGFSCGIVINPCVVPVRKAKKKS